jgi:hypothetical protein
MNDTEWLAKLNQDHAEHGCCATSHQLTGEWWVSISHNGWHGKWHRVDNEQSTLQYVTSKCGMIGPCPYPRSGVSLCRNVQPAHPHGSVSYQHVRRHTVATKRTRVQERHTRQEVLVTEAQRT